VVVEQEAAVEDAVWAVVAAAVAVVAVEEDVVAEASDQPTIKTRTKNNHCLGRPRLESEIVLDQTEGQVAIHTINCIPNRASRISPKAAHINGQKTRFVVATDLANIARRKILSTRNSPTSAYPRLLLPFYFYELQKKENAISFTIKTLWGFPFSCPSMY
jgi:hypothetical protein